MRPFKQPPTPARRPWRTCSATATWTGRVVQRRVGPREPPGRCATPTKRDQPKNAKPRTSPPLWRRSRLAWVIVWRSRFGRSARVSTVAGRGSIVPLFSLSPHTAPSLSQQQRPGHPPGTPERPGDRNHGQDGEFASGYGARADGQASRSASAVSSRSASPVLTTLSGSSSSEAASVAARGQCSTLRRLRLGPPR